MSRSRTAFALGLVVPLLVLGGCSSDEPEPRIAPTESPSPTDSPSAAPALDPVQTVRAWVEAQNEAMRSGKTEDVRALSADPCPACDGLIDPIEKVYAAGGHFDTAGWRIDRLKQARSDHQKSEVNAAVTIAGGQTVNASGEPPVSYEIDRSIMVFKLIRQDAKWLVSFIGFLS